MRTSDMEWMSLDDNDDDGTGGAKAQRHQSQPGKRQKPALGRGPRRPTGGGGGGGGGVTREPVRQSVSQSSKRRDRMKNVRGRDREGRGGGGDTAAGSKGGRERGQRRRRRLPPSDLAKRAQLLEALVLWTFRDVIVPLVSAAPPGIPSRFGDRRAGRRGCAARCGKTALFCHGSF